MIELFRQDLKLPVGIEHNKPTYIEGPMKNSSGKIFEKGKNQHVKLKR